MDKLAALNRLHKGARIAHRLNLSKQRWSMYKTGKNDMPESILDRLCAEYGLNKNEIAVE